MPETRLTGPLSDEGSQRLAREAERLAAALEAPGHGAVAVAGRAFLYDMSGSREPAAELTYPDAAGRRWRVTLTEET